jgi:hypothetical protein
MASSRGKKNFMIYKYILHKEFILKSLNSKIIIKYGSKKIILDEINRITHEDKLVGRLNHLSTR